MYRRAARVLRERPHMQRKKADKFTPEEEVRAAYLAGLGYSATEIGLSIRRDPSRVRSVLYRIGARLLPKTSKQTVLHVAVDTKALGVILEAADALRSDPAALAAAILEEIARDPILLRGIANDAVAGE